jgi:hypothetical protein
MTEVKDSSLPTLGSVRILLKGSTEMYVSIDEYTDHTPQNHRNSLDSINPVISDDTSDNPVIELSDFIDESQHVFVKARSLLMEHPSILNT